MRVDVDVELISGEVYGIPVTVSDIGVPSGLAVAPVVGGGTFAAATYFWVITGIDAYGETTASNEVSTAVALNGSANLTWGALPPGTTGVKVYRGTAAGAENALIATLGPVTAYTDTGTAGTANTPPTVNTAAIGDTTILTGIGYFCGFSLRETSGANKAVVEIQDGGSPLGEAYMPAGQTDKLWLGRDGIRFSNRINVHIVSGVFTGVVYARYDMVNAVDGL